ncbi:hypothetical protein IE4771_PE00536 (plasmid) [Rhizobium etli bv. mimosae str. IE4771]|uniref:Uncharacterized protein n=1 Tax=Rhizobium etli bv. mimosae str. IE4771 TaxID=1432050 RepID=A0A060IDP6_RHIET|nr:hypothetical protein IE4771_PE00536 [Rhizobium sp. IE4771]
MNVIRISVRRSRPRSLPSAADCGCRARGCVARFRRPACGCNASSRLDARWKGRSLPYKVFDKDQRVAHATIVENKRLGDARRYLGYARTSCRSLV